MTSASARLPKWCREWEATLVLGPRFKHVKVGAPGYAGSASWWVDTGLGCGWGAMVLVGSAIHGGHEVAALHSDTRDEPIRIGEKFR